MELKMPSPEQAHWGLRAMKTVALADGALDDAERQMLASVRTILGTTYAVDSLMPLTPEELASALTDRQIRHQLVQGLIVVSLIDGKANVRETETVEQFTHGCISTGRPLAGRYRGLTTQAMPTHRHPAD